MSLVVDMKYASMIRPYVRNFTRKNNIFNFSCPMCGDSRKNTHKARGYLFPGSDRLLYKCHNCSAPASMLKLLETIDGNLAREYQQDRYFESKQDAPKIEPAFAKPKFRATLDSTLVKVSSLPTDHFAKQYVIGRQIPSKWHYKLFYTDDFKVFANRIVPETFDVAKAKYKEPRLIIPLINRVGDVVGYQGRSFRPDHPVKYMTLLYNEGDDKIFNIDAVDLNRTIYALEGPIDAMFLDNAVAVTGGRQDTQLQRAGIGKDRTTLIYDNEPRNKDTIVKIEKAINAGWSVVVWPSSLGESDINKMVLAGYPIAQIKNIIDSNTFSGLMALQALASWRKV